jgi:predicted nucleic acid-binding protein
VSHLADTDVVISFLNGRREAVALVQRLRLTGLAISLPTYGEVVEGIVYSRDPASREDAFRRFLIGVEVLPLDVDVMRRFARIRGELRAAGQLIPDFDLLIAATAFEYNLTLVTRNLRHFDRIPGLTIYEGP